jgi:LCP family protein required for cell wall assembly
MEQNEPDWPSEPAAPGGGGRGGGREKWSVRKKLLVWGCTGLAAVIVIVAVGLVVLWRHLNGNITTEDAGLKPSAMGGKQDILFIGSDSRSGGNQTLGGGDVSGARSDTAMVFDSPADRRQGTEVSIPRDSMVQIPDCAASSTGGATVAANFGMFNSAFTEGGAPCTVKTVESLTGLTLTHYIAIDFEGVVGVVNALGGVKVCVTQAIDDTDSGLNIPAGTTTLNGTQALAFVRLRHSVGDGSDLERIQRQQYFLDQLEQQVRSAGLLTDPVKLYKVLDAATQSITTDPGLGTVTDLYDLAQTLNDVPSGKITYVTVPNGPYPEDPNRVVWTEPDATNLWNSLIDEANTAGASASSTGTKAAAFAGHQASSSAAEVALSRFEGVMRLALLADTPTDATGSAGSSSSATGTSSPGGADVGTCPVS